MHGTWSVQGEPARSGHRAVRAGTAQSAPARIPAAARRTAAAPHRRAPGPAPRPAQRYAASFRGAAGRGRPKAEARSPAPRRAAPLGGGGNEGEFRRGGSHYPPPTELSPPSPAPPLPPPLPPRAPGPAQVGAAALPRGEGGVRPWAGPGAPPGGGGGGGGRGQAPAPAPLSPVPGGEREQKAAREGQSAGRCGAARCGGAPPAGGGEASAGPCGAAALRCGPGPGSEPLVAAEAFAVPRRAHAALLGRSPRPGREDAPCPRPPLSPRRGPEPLPRAVPGRAVPEAPPCSPGVLRRRPALAATGALAAVSSVAVRRSRRPRPSLWPRSPSCEPEVFPVLPELFAVALRRSSRPQALPRGRHLGP